MVKSHFCTLILPSEPPWYIAVDCLNNTFALKFFFNIATFFVDLYYLQYSINFSLHLSLIGYHHLIDSELNQVHYSGPFPHRSSIYALN